MKKYIIAFSSFLFIFVISIVALNNDKKNRIDEVLNEQVKFLDITYKQGFDRFNVIADNVYLSFQNDKKLVDMLESVKNKSIGKVHNEMYSHLKDEFARLQQLEILGVQIITPENISILRMSDPDRYGDDLSDIRFSIKFANANKMTAKGFEEGKASHAFRFVYPLFKKGKHIGLLEIDFSSTMLQNYSMRAANIHTHFIVNRNVFKTNEWKSRILEPYEQSIEHKDYMFSLSDHIKHPRLKHSRVTLIEPLRDEINRGIESGKKFVVYKKVDNTVRVVAFLPIPRFKDHKTVAFLVSYTESDKILQILNSFYILVSVFTISLILVYVSIWKLLINKQKMENEIQYDGLTNSYNRKFFHNNITSILRSLDKDMSLGVIMLDIDFFKKVNDTYGHNVGDIVLKQFSQYVKSSIRTSDVLIRWGGEEFIVLMRTTSDEALLKVAENIRKKIKSSSFDTVGNITCSVGVAVHIVGEDISETIERSDKALYESKNGGRNRVSKFL